jgi:hypothetical protein
MTPRKPRLAPREAFTMPCKSCGTDYHPTEYQISTSRSYLCPACIAARVEAARIKREIREDSPTRQLGLDLMLHLQKVWR